MENYVKGKTKAKILFALSNTDGPMTIGGLIGITYLPRSTVKDCVNRLIIERSVIKKKFTKEDISPFEFRVSDTGRTPRYFYVLRYPAGPKKLQYFIDIGLI